MLAKGHFGLSLLILSILAIPIGFGPDYIMVIIISLSVALSSLPDIDVKLGMKHRGITHNLLFAIFSGVLFGIGFGYFINIKFGIIGFISAFLGIVLHLIGDLMTYQSFRPWWPFSNKKVSYGFFTAKNVLVNYLFLILGIVAFGFYVYLSSDGFNFEFLANL